MLKRTIVLFFVLLLISSIANALDRYQWIESDDKMGYFFDTYTLKFVPGLDGKPNTSIVDVWIKVVYNDDGRNFEIRKRTDDNLSTAGFYDLNYALFHYQINYKNNQICQLGYIYYANDGYILDSYETQPYLSRWGNITPGTIGEDWSFTLKKYVLNNFNNFATVYGRSN